MRKLTLVVLAAVLALACLLPLAQAEEPRTVTRFALSRGGYMVPQDYEFLHAGDACYVSKPGSIFVPVDLSVAEALEKIVSDYGLASWDGFRGSDPDVLDGEGFRLEIAFSDGKTVYASGENCFPAGYRDAVKEVESLLGSAGEASADSLPGDYIYAGEGFGSAFTLTLEPDGTYSFYEGVLSSYMGTGRWEYTDPYLSLSEEGGAFLYFTLIPATDALFFLSGSSTDFPYVKVPDLGRFDRVAQVESTAFLTLAFSSFDGGGFSWTAEAEDPSVITFTRSVEYGDPDHEELDGASFDVYFTVTGLKEGQTKLTVSGRSPIIPDEDYTYLITVDRDLNVTCTELTEE